MTDLTGKFAALSAQLAAQHTAMLAELAALRGAGPENTLKSVNESLWAIAGPAPGATLVELLAAIQAGPTAGADPNIAAILAAIGSLESNPAGETVKDLLSQIDVDIAGESTPTGADYSPVAPPAGGCGGVYSDSDYIQVSGWEVTSNPLRMTATFHTPVGDPGLAPDLIVTADENTYNALIITGGTGIADVCVAWEGGPASVYHRRYALGGGGVYNPTLTDVDLTGGATSGSVELSIDANAIVFYVEYATEEDVSDPNIVIWLSGFEAS